MIGIISGHCHYDFSSNDYGFLQISTTCDTHQEYGGLPDNAGTTNEQAIDIFFVNIAARTLKSVRVGRGNDREWTW